MEIPCGNLLKSEEETLIYSYNLEYGSLYFYIPPEDETYKIPSEINGHAVTRVYFSPNDMQNPSSNITSLIVPESITYLDWYDSGSLESVTIYNRDAEIYGLGRNSAGLNFYGYTGSTTEAYVNDHNASEWYTNKINFSALDADRAVIKEVSATLDGDIGMNYYLTFPQDILSESGAYAELAVNGRSTKMKLADMTSEADGSYKFTCWLNAKEMHDNVTFSLHNADGSPINIYTNGGNEINSFDYSLAEYFNNLSSISSADEKLVNIAKATLAYGSYAQKAFGYNVETASSTSDLSGISSENLAGHKMLLKEGDIPEGLTLSEMTLILETKTTLRLYFKTDDIGMYSFTLDDAAAELIEIPGLYDRL